MEARQDLQTTCLQGNKKDKLEALDAEEHIEQHTPCTKLTPVLFVDDAQELLNCWKDAC